MAKLAKKNFIITSFLVENFFILNNLIVQKIKLKKEQLFRKKIYCHFLVKSILLHVQKRIHKKRKKVKNVIKMTHIVPYNIPCGLNLYSHSYMAVT